MRQATQIRMMSASPLAQRTATSESIVAAASCRCLVITRARRPRLEPRRADFGGKRLTEMVPLAFVAPQPHEMRELRRRFDTFGDDLFAEAACQRDDRSGDRFVVPI